MVEKDAAGDNWAPFPVYCLPGNDQRKEVCPASNCMKPQITNSDLGQTGEEQRHCET